MAAIFSDENIIKYSSNEPSMNEFINEINDEQTFISENALLQNAKLNNIQLKRELINLKKQINELITKNTSLELNIQESSGNIEELSINMDKLKDAYVNDINIISSENESLKEQIRKAAEILLLNNKQLEKNSITKKPNLRIMQIINNYFNYIKNNINYNYVKNILIGGSVMFIAYYYRFNIKINIYKYNR